MPAAARFAAMAAPVPELDPDVLRSSTYGLRHRPPRPDQPLVDRVDRKLAHSLRFVFPRMTAPASRSLATMNASAGATRAVERERPGGGGHPAGDGDVVLHQNRECRAARPGPCPPCARRRARPPRRPRRGWPRSPTGARVPAGRSPRYAPGTSRSATWTCPARRSSAVADRRWSARSARSPLIGDCPGQVGVPGTVPRQSG